MIARVFSGLGVAVAAMLPGAASAASGIGLLVDRLSDQVSVCVALPVPELNTTFGQGAEALLDAKGTVDIDGF